jgi:hypothetical protein
VAAALPRQHVDVSLELAVALTDNFDRPAGVLVSEPLRLSRFGSWPVGRHSFLPGSTEFVASCCIPTPEPGVRGLLDPSGNLLTGDVWLVGDRGVVLRAEDGNIRVDIVGDPLFVRAQCFPENRFQTPNYLKTINHCGPDQYGNFNFNVGTKYVPDPVLRVSPSAGQVQISAVGKQAKV